MKKFCLVFVVLIFTSNIYSLKFRVFNNTGSALKYRPEECSKKRPILPEYNPKFKKPLQFSGEHIIENQQLSELIKTEIRDRKGMHRNIISFEDDSGKTHEAGKMYVLNIEKYKENNDDSTIIIISLDESGNLVDKIANPEEIKHINELQIKIHEKDYWVSYYTTIIELQMKTRRLKESFGVLNNYKLQERTKLLISLTDQIEQILLLPPEEDISGKTEMILA